MKRTYINKPDFKNFSWSNYWYYYKFHTIAGVFVLILLIMFITEMISNTKPDLLINYIGWPPIESTREQDFNEKLKDVVVDINKDKKTQIDLVSLTLPKFALDMKTQGDPEQAIEWEQKPDEQDIMLLQKVSLEMTVGDPSLIILDKGVVDLYLPQGSFYSLDEFETNNKKISGSNENDPTPHVYAISVEGNKFLEDMGIDTKDKYITIKTITQPQSKRKYEVGMFEQAKSALNYIINY